MLSRQKVSAASWDSYIIWTPRQEPPNLWQIPLVLEPSEKCNTELRCAGGNLKPTLHLAHQLSTSTLGFRRVVDAAKRPSANESRNFHFRSESCVSSVDLHSNSIVCNCMGFAYARIKKSPFSRSQRKIPKLYVRILTTSCTTYTGTRFCSRISSQVSSHSQRTSWQISQRPGAQVTKPTSLDLRAASMILST